MALRDVWAQVSSAAANAADDDPMADATAAAQTGLQEIIDLMRPEIEMRQDALSAYQDILSGETDITQQAGYAGGLAAGQEAISSSAAARGMSLSGLNIENLAGFGSQYYQQQRQQALGELGGMAGMTMPSMQATTGAMGELASLPMQQYQMQLAAQQGRQASQAGMLGGIGGLFSGIAALSDVRTKENITPHSTVHGLDLYEFEYKPEFKDQAGHGRYVGVLAQDIIHTYPEAVVVGWNGYYMVDYSKLPVEMKNA